MISSDGLFTVKCKCGEVFAAEVGKCSCGQTKGDLQLDVQEFLNRVYSTQDEKSIDNGMDIVFDVFFNLYDRFDIMNEIMDKVDVNKINIQLMITFMSQTFKYSSKVTNHIKFVERSITRMRELKTDEKRIRSLTKGLMDEGNYWETMKALGASEWLAGPKPND